MPITPMIRALLYLQFYSTRNRLVLRLKRLKQPKYLLGGIVGALYVYFYFFRFLFGWSGGPGSRASMPAEGADVLEALGAAILFVIVLLSWLLPHERAALAFTEAEVAFLFPAPISRRGLIHYKLARSQLGILFSILVLTLVTNRLAGGTAVWIRVLGWWVILSTLNLHFIAASFARTMLLDRGISNWRRRVVVLLVLMLLAGAIGFWFKFSMPHLTIEDLRTGGQVTATLQTALSSGPAAWVLYPFRLVVRPFLAANGLVFLWALIPALGLMSLHYWWVMRSDVAFEEASVEYSRKLADRITAARAGRWQSGTRTRTARRAPFKLRPAGPPLVALMWKNLIATGQMFTLRFWLLLLWIAVLGTFMLNLLARNSDLLPAIGVFCFSIIGMSLFLGPQLLRQDLRHDLPVADVLKLHPLPGWQVVLGEMLAPMVVLTALQWLLLVVGVGFIAGGTALGSGVRTFVFGASAALLLPALNLLLLLIPNAAVLLFPAWFQTGKDSPHGVEATGQRLIYSLAQLLAFAAALIPAGLVGGGMFLLVRWLLGVIAAVPATAVAATLVIGVEAALGVAWLGRVFERFDLSAEPVP